MASSSSGLSCLAVALAQVYGLKETYEGQFSVLARLGSGSACRSVYGGFVEWIKGFNNLSEVQTNPDVVSQSSIARKFDFEENDYWLENLKILICIAKPEDG